MPRVAPISLRTRTCSKRSSRYTGSLFFPVLLGSRSASHSSFFFFFVPQAARGTGSSVAQLLSGLVMSVNMLEDWYSLHQTIDIARSHVVKRLTRLLFRSPGRTWTPCKSSTVACRSNSSRWRPLWIVLTSSRPVSPRLRR